MEESREVVGPDVEIDRLADAFMVRQGLVKREMSFSSFLKIHRPQETSMRSCLREDKGLIRTHYHLDLMVRV